jgi:hypothetical protein
MIFACLFEKCGLSMYASMAYKGRILSETPKFVQKRKAGPTGVESRLGGTV